MMDNEQQKKSGSGLSSATWAVIIALVIGGWLLSGQFSGNATETSALKTDTSDNGVPVKQQRKKTAPLFEVTTRMVKAEPREAKLIIRGQTKATAVVNVRAETHGVVTSIAERKGEFVETGSLLCRLDVGARNATMLEAKAARDKAQADFKASSRLASKGFSSTLKKSADKALLDAARAAHERARIDLENISIKAPFSGIIESQSAKIGDYLRQADVCATLVDIDPILLTGAVAERDIASIKAGMAVSGQLVTGESLRGTISFISSSSDTTTKTFLIEARVPNVDRSIRAGITADITIPLKAGAAHRVASSILSLDDGGRIGLRIVDDKNVVRFMPVSILSNEQDAVWVSGLPPTAQVITVGQEYVGDGQTVMPKLESPGASRAQTETSDKRAAIH